ncbi:SDR family NAD(P)-dependent oxidoreductase, partial [Streptomyces sodiiphilus]|uniref:SDR family NAD(P)-dependent oxidoreductase n=1 Tax=Streptomyces sodiiphilus TaxID=226217 RepID=UPI0031CE1215
LDAEYWYTNLRRTVEFETATRALLGEGHRLFVESSPHPVLTAAVEETIAATDAMAAVTGTLRRDEGGPQRLLHSLGKAYAYGAPVTWDRLFAGRPAQRTGLPTYPFQRQRYWVDPVAPAAGAPEGSPADEDFWSAVENHDVEALTAALGTRADTPLADVLPALATWRGRRSEQARLDSWCYRIGWHPVELPAAPVLSGTWLLVVPDAPADAAGLARTVTAGLTAHGAEVVGVPVAAATADRGTLAAAVAEATAGTGGPVAGVLSLLALDEEPCAGHEALPAGLSATIALIQALGDATADARLWCVTRGAVAAGSAVRPSPVQAMLWGLGGTVALEHPQRWGGLIDLPAPPDPLDDASLDALAGTLAGGHDEEQLAVRRSGTLARRLRHAVPRPAGRDWQPRGTVLVTGGTGGVGAQIARWLARNGAEHLVLTSRRGPQSPGAGDLREELTGLGTRVTLAACDVADRGALASLLETLTPGSGADRLTAVVHAAGTLRDSTVGGLTREQTEEVLRPKAAGARNLHDLTRDLELDAFVLLSSIAGTVGAAGQGNYAAANAFLDALAQQRRADGLPATSVAWSAWADGGMLDDDMARQLRRRGVTPLDGERAATALGQALARDDGSLVVADINWERFAPSLSATRRLPLLADIPEAVLPATGTPDHPGEDSGSLRGRLRALGPADRDEALLELVGEQAAAALGYADAAAIETGRAFKDLGFDSLTAVDLRNRLNAATGLRLPVTLVFDYPTAGDLAVHLREELLPSAEPAGRPGGADTVLLDNVPAAMEHADIDTATDDEMFTLLDEMFDVLVRELNTP